MKQILLKLILIFIALPSSNAQNVFYSPSIEDFPNPERGFYIQNWPKSVQLMRDARENQNITTIRSYHRIDDYVNTDIPQSFLDTMQAGLNRVRDAGAKMIVRFSYNFGYEGTDAIESRVLGHIDQLGPVLAQNSDVIVLVEAGFIGAWGEWHSSDFGLENNDSRRKILFSLLSYLPDDRMVALRYNGHKKEIYNNNTPLSKDSAYSGSYRSRTGAHNDCLGASEDDWGTYSKASIEAEKDYLTQDNLYVVQEGETCNENPPYSTCSDILASLQQMRWDLLNINYHRSVLQSWVDGGCMEEIKRKLGYRFRMLNARIDDTVEDGILSASIELVNDGWGKTFNPRSIELILREAGGASEIVLPLNIDPRFWSPGDTIVLTIEQPIPQSVSLGKYELFLNLPDPSPALHDRPDYSIQLANEKVWEASTGYNSLLHNVQINSVTPGFYLPGFSSGANRKPKDILAVPVTGDSEKICFALYTVSDNILKLTAQFYPFNDEADFKASLEIKKDKSWVKVAESEIIYPGLIASFRVENWDDSEQYKYRVNHQNTSFYEGTIQRNPIDKEVITVFAFTGNSTWRKVNGDYVNDDKSDIVENIKKANPDLLFFSGDQVYNHSRHYEAWLKFGRDYGEVISNTPTICLPDDHDVGQYNLWGSDGKKSLSRGGADGGYYMPVEYINEVERAQTSHLPDPFDPTPVKRGIGVYYTDLTWGGVGFAIIEDRKFKTGPVEVLPQDGSRPDHYTSLDYNSDALDVAGAKLLGERQLKFLEEWGQDWTNTEMKAVLSQTIFAGGAHLHDEDGRVYADLDANGWPQTGRNKALKEIRKAYAIMIAGDQHLATVIHHGIEDWNDSGYSFCVPSIANYYLRWWDPAKPGKNIPAGKSELYGEFHDGFNNKITMEAVANPDMNPHPAQRGEGFGVVKFNKKTRKITMECWPRNVDITNPGTKQYEGWPITINQANNYDRQAKAYLPTININKANQVVKVIFEQANEVIYTLRINGKTFVPRVFKEGKYTIIVGEGEQKQTFNGLDASQQQSSKKITIKL